MRAKHAHPNAAGRGRLGVCPFARLVWCLLRRLIYTRSAHPPNRPKTPTKPLSVPFTPWARDPTETRAYSVLSTLSRFSSGESGNHRFYEAVRFLCGVGSYSEPSASQAFAGCRCGLLSGGWVCAQSLVWCGVCFAGFFILALPTHPTARKPPRSRHSVAASLRGRAVSTASTKPWDFCAVSAPTRSRPLRGLLRAAFAGCLCAEMLLLALPLPPRPNMAGYFQQPAILWPWREGGASKRGAPTPCPRRPAPPTS